MKNRIESIKLVREVDNTPDLSYLGEYHAQPSASSIDRQSRWELVEVRWHDPEAYGHYWLCVKRFGAMRVSRHKTRKSAEAACEE